MYLLGCVIWDDGNQVYLIIFDCCYNINLLGVYIFGKNKFWEVSLCWNMGFGFFFIQIQGFYEQNDFINLFFINILIGNFGLGIIFMDEINGGCLFFYYCFDVFVKCIIEFGKYIFMDINLSIINVYNWENIFYVDWVINSCVN